MTRDIWKKLLKLKIIEKEKELLKYYFKIP